MIIRRLQNERALRRSGKLMRFIAVCWVSMICLNVFRFKIMLFLWTQLMRIFYLVILSHVSCWLCTDHRLWHISKFTRDVSLTNHCAVSGEGLSRTCLDSHHEPITLLFGSSSALLFLKDCCARELNRCSEFKLLRLALAKENGYHCGTAEHHPT